MFESADQVFDPAGHLFESADLFESVDHLFESTDHLFESAVLLGPRVLSAVRSFTCKIDPKGRGARAAHHCASN